MEFQWFISLWSDNISIAWWKMLLIGTFFLALDFLIFIASWFIRREIILECGYPKRNRKTINKRVSTFSVLERFLLLRLVKEAEKPSSFLCFSLICHFFSMLGFFSCFVGWVACLITLANGWCLMLLIFSEITTFFITGVIEFIPHWLYVPSIRRKYRMKQK